MALIIKPDETTAVKKRIHFAIYDIDGKITDHEAFGLSLAWAVDTFAPAASDLKVGYDNAASANYGGTFAYRKNGEWYYEFSNAEVAASLGADTVYVEFYRTNYRTFVVRIPLRNDVESIKADTITAASAAADLTTELQAGLATAAALTTAQTAISAIKLSTDNLPSDPADESLIIAATDAILADVARVRGLLHENSLMDGGAGVLTGPTYSAKKVLTSARVRVFANAAALAAATPGAADGADGEVYRYTITGEDTGAGLAKSFRIPRAL